MRMSILLTGYFVITFNMNRESHVSIMLESKKVALSKSLNSFQSKLISEIPNLNYCYYCFSYLCGRCFVGGGGEAHAYSLHCGVLK